MRYSSPRGSADRIGNAASRSTIQKVADDHLFQQVKLNGHAGEGHDDVEHAQPYGLVSNVQPPTQDDGGSKSNKAAESFIVYMSGDRSHPVALVTGDRRYRMMNLKSGEVALHDDQGQQLHLTRKGIVQTALNSQKHVHNIMPDKSSALNKDQKQSGGGAGGSSGSPTSQFGQTPWQTLIDNDKQAAFAVHSIDKTTHHIQHPATLQHEVSDPKDAADPTIPTPKKKVIHSHTLDQKKGHILSIQKGKHIRKTDPAAGITDSVNNGAHSRVIDAANNVIKDVVNNGAHSHTIDAAAGISAISSAAINHTAPTLGHNGNTSVSGTLGVSGLASFAKGLGTGALEVAADADGGLTQITMGAQVTLGLTTDTLAFSTLPVNAANDSAAASAGVPVKGVYRNGSVLMVRVT